MRDQKTKEAFIRFLQDPATKDLRFWQAVRNFSPWNFIYGSDSMLGGTNIVDTFYIEADDERGGESNMGDLKKWADDQSPYVRLIDGDSIVAKYMGYEIIPNKFDAKKKSVKYTLIVEGEEKYFESGASSVAYQFDEIEEGAMVKISRSGDGPSTTYKVKEVVDKSGDVSKEQARSIADEMSG
jgi:hypothetical protein